MERRQKVELFEQIRREHEFGGQSIRTLAQHFGVHRRMIRQALGCALPPERKRPLRERPKWQQVHAFIDGILEADRQAPRKQRHTSHRIHERILQELPEVKIAERTVRQYVQRRKHELGLEIREVMVPQEYRWGKEAQVDWYEVVVELAGERQTVQVFSMRSMASGAAFHRAYPRATQQAFLEAHEYAFAYFGGVFSRLRYDNLSSAVKRVLRGSRREESVRFIAFRSHWRFEASFCTPGQGHEKGGVEGEVGRFRRNHLVPVPIVADRAELNRLLMAACQRDEARRIGERAQSVGEAMRLEQSQLQSLQEGFELAEESFCVVDGKGCIQARTNFYSTPLKAGSRCRVRVLPATVEIWHEGRRVAEHERCYSRRQQVLDLEHYLDVLVRKPGALAGSRPLAQWRAAGRWSPAYDEFWQRLQQRHGFSAGTRLMIEVLQLGRKSGYERLTQAIEQALHLGTHDAAAVGYLLSVSELRGYGSVRDAESPVTDLEEGGPEKINLELLDSLCAVGSHNSAVLEEYYQRPMPRLEDYDLLLEVRP